MERARAMGGGGAAPIAVPPPAAPPAEVAPAAAAAPVPEADEAAQHEQLVDDAWQPLEGGPWTAKLMRPSRQPVATAAYRNFYASINFDPSETNLTPGGQVKFPIVAGAPAEGIICPLPGSWTSRQRTLVFKLKLSKAGATASEVAINSLRRLRRHAQLHGEQG